MYLLVSVGCGDMKSCSLGRKQEFSVFVVVNLLHIFNTSFISNQVYSIHLDDAVCVPVRIAVMFALGRDIFGRGLSSTVSSISTADNVLPRPNAKLVAELTGIWSAPSEWLDYTVPRS